MMNELENELAPLNTIHFTTKEKEYTLNIDIILIQNEDHTDCLTL